MLRSLVVFACGFLLAESLVLKKRTPDLCERLVECTNSLEYLYYEDENLPTFLSSPDEAAVDRFCQRKSELDPCFEAARDECDNQEFVVVVDAALAKAGYICSDTGRQVTVALAESECSTDDTKQQRLSVDIELCYDDFEFDVVMLTSTALSEHRDLQASELCPFVKSWIECTVAAASTTCGDAYGAFMSDVLEVWSGLRFEQLSCDEIVNDRRAIIEKVLDTLGESQFAARSFSSQRKRDDADGTLLRPGKRDDEALLRPGKRIDADATLLGSGKRDHTTLLRPGKRVDATILRPGKRDDATLLRPGKRDETLLRPGKRDDETLLRPGKRDDETLLRPGKRDDETLVRPGKRDDGTLVRPGKRDDETLLRPGKRDDGTLLRPGKRDDTTLLRPGKRDDATLLRPGKRDDETLLRPGKRDDTTLVRPGKRDDGTLLRPGKRDDGTLLRPGKRDADGTWLRSGKRDDADETWLRPGKRDDDGTWLRPGKRDADGMLLRPPEWSHEERTS